MTWNQWQSYQPTSPDGLGDADIFCAPDQFGSITGTTLPAIANGLLAFDKDADEGALVTVQIPKTWTTFDLYLAVYNPFGSGFAGDVKWVVKTYAGGSPTTTNTTITMPAEATASETLVASGATVASFTTTGVKSVRIDLIRDADNVADTFTGDASVMGLIIRRAS